MKTTTKTMGMVIAILMTTGLVSQSTLAASKAERAAQQQKRNKEALAKMTIKVVVPTRSAIAEMKTVTSKEWTVPTLAMKMNRIPAGTFKMGSPASEALRHDDETLHDVTISKPFYMGTYEVTQAQFYKLMLPADYDHASWTFYRGPFWRGTAVHYRRTNAGQKNSPVGYELQPDHPMECVTWPRAIEFCKKLNTIESKARRLPRGYEYRLPTEAEWEYACRAGTKTPFNIAEADYAKIQKTYKARKRGHYYDSGLLSFAYMMAVHPRLSLTAKVGGNRKPNAWGLYDMHGNVAEWCLDTKEPYSDHTMADPVTLGPGEKIIRGGGIGAPPRSLRSAARHAVPKDIDYYGMLGLRLVLAPKVAVKIGE
jgi:formylglycine-generating enzyme required for sulfatase activity